MEWLFAQYLAIYNDGNLPNSIKCCQSRYKILIKLSKMWQDLKISQSVKVSKHWKLDTSFSHLFVVKLFSSWNTKNKLKEAGVAILNHQWENLIDESFLLYIKDDKFKISFLETGSSETRKVSSVRSSRSCSTATRRQPSSTSWQSQSTGL